MDSDLDTDDFDDDDEYGPRCMSCGGEGIVQCARNPVDGAGTMTVQEHAR